VAQAVGIVRVASIMNEFSRLSIKSVKPPVARSNPEHARPVFVNYPDIVVAQAIRIIGIVSVVDKSPIPSIESIKPSAISPNPEHARPVLVNRPDSIASQAIGILRIVPIHVKLVPIIFVQSIVGAKPHEAFAVLQNAGHRTARKPLFKRNSFKFNVVISGLSSHRRHIVGLPVLTGVSPPRGRSTPLCYGHLLGGHGHQQDHN